MIFFNEISKILPTEIFLVPFRIYEITKKPEIDKMIEQRALTSDIPPVFCPVNFSGPFATNTSGFNVNWTFHQIDLQIFLAQQSLTLIRNEIALFLTPPQPPKSTRHRRAATMGLPALAAVGLFGGGLVVGDSKSCCLRGIFGNFQDQSKANTENVHRLADSRNSFTDYVTEFMTNTDEKFFLVEKELAALNSFQSEIASTQGRNWVTIQEQSAVYEQNS